MLTVRKNKSISSALVITIIGFALLCIFVAVMLTNAMNTSSEEALKTARDSIVRAAVSCYAYEGVYPEDLQYLIDNYNLAIDLGKYNVHFDKISDNLLPNIIVTERKGEVT